MRAFKPLTALLAAISLSAGACASTCDDACENLAKVCEAQFAASSVALDQDVCASTCEDNLGHCPESQVDCLAAAETCDEAQACPACSP